jgi:hypothetical protein
MPFYDLQLIGRHDIVAAPAADRHEALALFGKALGILLTFEGDGAPDFLLDEWEQSPHWIKPTIPVFQDI